MNRKLSTLMLAATALLASCSQNDELQSTVNDNEGLKPMTISVTLPEGMTTRAIATDDEKDAYCFVQILNKLGEDLEGGHSAVQGMTRTGNGYTATVYLKGEENYNFLFWATSGDEKPTDLRNVAYTNGETLVWAGKESAAWSANGISCTLKHVVSRITLTTTTDLTVSGTNPLTITVPTTFNAYNVLNMEPVKTATPSGFTYTFDPITVSGASENAPVQIGHFYALVGNEPQNLTLHYKGSLGNSEDQIPNVPLAPDTHVVLKGDVANFGLVSGTITATVVNDWIDKEHSFENF